jgi:glycosyltransferase involved in cell wall biosynthesis
VALPRPVAPRTPPPPGAPPVLLFVGALDYGPNVVAVRRLLDEVMPAVLRSRPDALLQVVGRGAGRVRDRRPWLQVHADVPDVAPFLAGASACVVPLTSGGGTRLKILEALAAGVPVVSTAVGAEGLRDLDGELLRVPAHGAAGGAASGAAGLADVVLEVLAAPPTPQAALAVAQRVVDAYAWSATLAPLARALGRDAEPVGPAPGRSAEIPGIG